ncbi:MAG: hypothetical protein ACRDUW_26225 [Pseudonocardiaceae bacterium]
MLTADTYTSVLPDLAHHAAEATARLILALRRHHLPCHPQWPPHQPQTFG